MVLELARPSEAQCFPPGGDFFEAVLLQQPQATEAVEKCCFSRISDDTLGSFLAWFWNYSSSFRGTVFFPPGGDFFEAVLLQQPQATESVENLSKNVVFLGFQTTR